MAGTLIDICETPVSTEKRQTHVLFDTLAGDDEDENNDSEAHVLAPPPSSESLTRELGSPPLILGRCLVTFHGGGWSDLCSVWWPFSRSEK